MGGILPPTSRLMREHLNYLIGQVGGGCHCGRKAKPTYSLNLTWRDPADSLVTCLCCCPQHLLHRRHSTRTPLVQPDWAHHFNGYIVPIYQEGGGGSGLSPAFIVDVVSFGLPPCNRGCSVLLPSSPFQTALKQSRFLGNAAQHGCQRVLSWARRFCLPKSLKQ